MPPTPRAAWYATACAPYRLIAELAEVFNSAVGDTAAEAVDSPIPREPHDVARDALDARDPLVRPGTRPQSQPCLSEVSGKPPRSRSAWARWAAALIGQAPPAVIFFLIHPARLMKRRRRAREHATHADGAGGMTACLARGTVTMVTVGVTSQAWTREGAISRVGRARRENAGEAADL